MDLPTSHFEVDAAQDLPGVNTGVKIGDLEHAGGQLITAKTSPESTSIGTTLTDWVAGRLCGEPSDREKVLPCRRHSISHTSAKTSPSESG